MRSLADVSGLVTTVARPFNLVQEVKRHQNGSTSRARALNHFGAFVVSVVYRASLASRARALSLLGVQNASVQHKAGLASRARELNQLCAGTVSSQGLQADSTSRARELNRLGVLAGTANQCVADLTSRARELSLLCTGLIRNRTSSTTRARLSSLFDSLLHKGHRASSTSRARALNLLGVLMILTTIVTGIGIFNTNSAQAATSNQLNFQGRLLTNTGGLVPDGTYNMQFDLYYQAVGGSTQWTEDRLNTNTQGVTIRNGYFSVYLGEYDAFPTLDWSQDLYLGMTIRGTGSCAWGSCLAAGAVTPDSEMTPRFKMTSVPYAFVSSNVASSDTNAVSSNSNGVSISSGDALGATSNSGNITIDAGSATGTAGQVLLGTNNASGLTLGRAGATTTLQGPVAITGTGTALTVTNDAVFNGNITLGNATTDTLTVEANAIFNGSLTVSTGDTFINSGATLNTAMVITDKATGGLIGTAAATVDGATTFNVNQTTAGQALSLDTPTNATAGRVVYVNNIGSTSFTMYGTAIGINGSNAFIWNGTQWVTTVSLSGSSVSLIGTMNSVTKSADGAVISGNSIYLQTADITYPGLVSVGAQTFAGVKTFNNGIVLAANQSLTVTGGNTASRPGSPTEGMVYYDTTTKSLLTYANGKWQGDRTDALLVAASNSSQADKDSADYVGDGNTGTANDGDQIQINAALTAAAGRKVVLLAGTYVADATILIPNETTLQGVGNGSIVELADLDATDNLVENSDTTTGAGVTIRDLWLNGRKDLNTAGTQNGISLNGIGFNTTLRQGASILNVKVNNFRNHNIYAYATRNTTIADSFISESGIHGIYMNGSRNTLTNNVIVNNAQYGVVFNGALYSSLVGNQISENTVAGIGLTGNSSNNTISNNNFNNNGGSGTAQSIYIATSSDTLITGNTFIDFNCATTCYAIDISDITSTSTYLSSNTLNSSPAMYIRDLGTSTIFSGQSDYSGNIKLQAKATMKVLLNSDTDVAGTLTVTSAGNVAFQRGADYSTVGSTDNVNFGTGAVIRLTGASAQTITGIAGGVDGRILTLINAGSSTATISNASASSLAANRITTGTGADITVPANASVTLVYDSGASLWRVTSAAASTGGAGVNSLAVIGSTPNANGASISGTTLTLQPASATLGGALTSGAQSIGGTKTFESGQVVIGANGATGAYLILDNFAGQSAGIYLGASGGDGRLEYSTAGVLGLYASGVSKLNVDFNSVDIVDGAAFTVEGLTTLSGGLTVETGDTFTFNGDAFTDFTGGGLVNTSGLLSVDTTSATGFFQNGGNNFGGNATLGTNGAGQTLGLKTAGTTRVTLDATGNLAFQQASTISSTSTLSVQSGTASSLSIASGTTGDVTLDSGTTGAVNIGTGASAKVVTLGSVTGASITNILAGTGDASGAINISAGNAGVINVGNNASTNKIINIGSAGNTNAASTIFIGSTIANQTQSVTVGSLSSANNVILLQGGTSAQAVRAQASTGGTITIGSTATNNSVIIGSTNTTSATTVRSGTGGIALQGNTTVSGANTFDVGTGATSLGGTLSVSSLATLNGGLTVTGAGISLNASSNFGTNINTGTSTGTVAIGNSLSTTSVLGVVNINTSGTALTSIGNAGSVVTATGSTINLNSSTIVGSATTQNLFNTVATTLNLAGASTTVTIGATTGTLTVRNANQTFGNAAGLGVFTNNGATRNTTLALTNFATGGAIGTAAATVDVYTGISVAQTTASQTLTIPSPTGATQYGRTIYLSNIGTTSFVVAGTAINPGSTTTLVWSNTSGGASWQLAGSGGAGISTLAVIGSVPNANGATISGTTLTLQPADGSFGGVVTTGTQTFAGAKTFAGNLNGDVEVNVTNSNAGSSAFAEFQANNSSGNRGAFGVGSVATTAGVWNNRAYVTSSTGANGISLVTQGTGSDLRFFTGGQVAGNERLRVTDSTTSIYNNLVIGDTNTDTLTINAGTSGSGITFSDASFQNCVLTTSGAGVLTCSASGSIITLQGAYTGGNAITTTDNRNIEFNLADTTTDSKFIVDILGTGNTFEVRDGGTSVLSVVDGGAVTFQNVTDSTTAFKVQNQAGGTSIFNVDTVNSRVGIGTDAPAYNLQVNGTVGVLGSTANSSAVYIGAILNGNTSSQTGFSNQAKFEPGALTTAVFGFQNIITLQNSATSVGTLSAGYNRLDLSGTYSGSITTGTGLQIAAPTLSGTNRIDNYYGLYVNNPSANTGNTSGTLTNVGLRVDTFTAAAGTGGTLNNQAIRVYVPTGSGAGTTNNRGLFVTGGSTGSRDYAIYSDSASQSYFSGNVGIGDSSPVALLTVGTSDAFQVNASGNTSTTGTLTVTGASSIFQNASNSTSAFKINNAGSSTLLEADTANFLLKVAPTQFLSSGSTQTFAASGSITGVDSFSTIAVNATGIATIVTLPAPSAGGQVIGRIIYVTAVNASNDFTLRLSGTSIDIAMRKNSTATLIWNGTGWTAAGASSSTDLQSAYSNTLTSAGGAEIVLNPTGGAADGLTVRNNNIAPIIGGLFEVQTSIGSNLFSVNNNATEYASNGGAETPGASGSTFPASTWSAAPSGGTVSRYTVAGDYIATGLGSVSVVTAATANQGATNRLSTALTPNLRYSVSFAIRGTTSLTTLDASYSPDGTNTSLVSCATGQTVTQGAWTRVNCSFYAPASGITSANAIFIRQSDAVARTFYIENLSVTVKADVNHAVDGSVDDAGGFATNWTSATGGGTITRDTSMIYDTSASAKVDTTATVGQGIRNNMSITPSVSTQYLVTFYARSSNTFNDIRVRYSRDGGTSMAPCVDYNTQDVSTSVWTRITCLFTTDGTTPTNADLIIDQPTATARTFYVDALSVTLNSNTASNVKIGGGALGGPTTLLTLDRSAGPPVAANNDAYLGSMYYDTVTGRIQCYESGGWGTCGSPPDNIVNLNPEYAGSVLNGTGVGTMTADVCASGAGLGINDGTGGSPTLCASGEARNFYKWTSPQATQQTYSIYITYQLPSTFDGFSSDDTVQLTARVDNTTNAAVSYEMFKSQSGSLTKCGTGETTVASVANTWQTVGINGNEATGCSFSSASANGFVLFKLNLKAKSNANAYVSTLTFTTTGR